ncbi:hypothetical protein LSH36_326g04078 [Paralvinella palmiformis]|uniref:C2H2-type domain-containing protein n=1 Tax=Paralvinella palmiformis TaxID=53620 RepID=A0AAD9JGE3_9ANNE|nr:hypothetical protein LSH36_326g04078 [Paralvinella palmiformis]
MSLQVKFPFGRGHAPVHTCRTCGYMTRHRAMFERHTKRCSHEMASNSQTSSPSHPLPSPPVCRNYRCEKCGFATSKSKLYLHHRREIHGENFSIYPCDQCEYASRHKSKVIRHRSLVHKDVPSDPEFPKELDSSHNNEALQEILLQDDGSGEYKIDYESDDDFYMQPDENQNTPVKKKPRLMTSDEKNKEDNVSENGTSGTSTEGTESPSGTTFIPDPTEDAYKYILSKSDDVGSPVYVCSLCTYSNSHKWKVATHVRNVHMRKTLFKCPYCEFVTERKIEWCVHKTAHTEKVVHSCRECSYRTTMKRNFERHLAHHVMEGPFKCTLCSYSSTGEAAVQRHMAEYHPSPDKQLAIDSIHTSNGTTSKSLSPGPLVIDETSEAEPPQTDAPVKLSDKVMSPASSGHEVQCKLCSVWFKNETRLRIHMVSHSDEAPHICSICKLRYKRPADLNRHMKRKHGTKTEDLSSDIEQEQPLDLCVKKSDDESEVDPDKPLDLSCKSSSSSPSPSHVYRTSEIKCSYCSYMAKWPSDLRRHMLVHSIEKRFHCHVCNKKYKYQFDLNMHMRKSHRLQAGRTRVSSAAAFGRYMIGTSTPKDGGNSETKVRQLRRSQPKESQQIVEEHYTETGVPEILKCTYCDYIGKYPAEVQRHELLHTGSQPYLCLFCTYRTFWKGDVKRHLVKHHKNEVDRYGELPELVNLCYKPQGCHGEVDAKRDREEENEFDNGEEDDPECENPEVDIYEEMEKYAKEIDGRKLFKCPKCTLAYDVPAKLKTHMEIHEDLKRFMCSDCGERCNSRWEVERHMNAEHPGALARVIELTEDEARETLDDFIDSYHKHPKLDDNADDTSQEGENDDYVDDVEALANIQGLDDYARVMNPDSIEDDDEQTEPVYKKPHSLLDSIPGGPHTLGGSDGMDTLIATVAAGRYRRFKCSLCGKRSNWKWDVKKHIRCTHHAAQVIEMTEEEAKATFHEVLKTKSKDDVYRFEEEGEDLGARPKWRPFKCSKCGKRSNVKAELNKHMMDCAQGAEMIVLTEAEAEATFVAECGHYVDKKQEGLSSDLKARLNPEPSEQPRIGSMSKVKKYKCSICPYRSDYRSDISRHLKRKHHKAKGKILILRAEYAAATLPSYKKTWAKKKFVITPEKVQDLQEEGNTDDLDHCVRVVDPEEEEKPRTSTGSAMLGKSHAEQEEMTVYSSSRSPSKVWQCSKCDYQNNNKMVIVSHFKTHGQGHAFQCRVCPYTSDYRGSIYRHVKAIHKRKDYQNVISYCALMEVDSDSSAHHGGQSESVPAADVKPPEALDVVYVVKMFQCKLCPSKTIHKHNLVRHIKEKHPEVPDPHSKVSEVETITKKPPTSGSTPKSRMKYNREAEKMLKCDLCPFKTLKYGLLKIHSQFHKPQSGEQFKCKYCPFYVSTMRRLIQHMQLHEQSSGEGVPTNGQSSAVTNSSSSPMRSGGKARHFCEKCPYVSINKNDFIYHKQFHRPKPAAPFKCEFCPYWVSLRRLLTQHKKVHSPEYKLQYYPREMVSAQEKLSSSPAKSDKTDVSVEMDDIVEVTHLKQQIITSKITTVPITPEKLKSPRLMDRADDTIMRGYVVDSSGRIIMNRSYQKLHKCRYCPYTNVRLANLCLHEKMHGRDGGEKELYQCNYCDYQVGNKGLLSHHVKVHSIQYQPGRDDINDVEAMNENFEFIGESKDVEIKTEHCDDDDDEGKNKSDEENNNYVMKFREKEMIKTDPGTHLEVGQLPNRAEYYIKIDERRRGPVLEKATMKKWCCEQCPYATMKRSQFEKHILLHGSKQKYPCEFCDYSVPGYHLLLQHKRLHLMPNNNLLNVQSISNLQRLPEIPADVATAAQIGRHDLQVHDHWDLYENSPDFVEPKKLFRCDRCPYTNSRRDHLLSHLKFHMISSDLRCPYCDYSVSKVHLLNQHIKVHFSNPGTEMSAEPKLKADLFLKKEPNQPDFFTALELKQLSKPRADDEQPTDLSLKSSSQDVDTQTSKDKTSDGDNVNSHPSETEMDKIQKLPNGGDDPVVDDTAGVDDDDDVPMTCDSENREIDEPAQSTDANAINDDDDKMAKCNTDDVVMISDDAGHDREENQPSDDKASSICNDDVNNTEQQNTEAGKDDVDDATGPSAGEEAEKICKYCERCFTSSEKRICHEKQHLLESDVTVRA